MADSIRARAIKLYCEMFRIRKAEEKIVELYAAGHISAPVHLSIGQEAVAAGVMGTLYREDKIVSNHRCHAHYLAKGGDLQKMFAELCGRLGGCARGKGGTMHLFDDAAGHTVSSPIVGAAIAFAVGIALSAKLRGDNKIAVAFFGDGAVEEGIFWESLNFASVHHLPVLFVCENNFYATHSHVSKRQPPGSIEERVRPFGIKTFSVDDGNDAFSVFAAAQLAADEARNGRPSFLEAKTYRWKEHWGIGEDWDLGYRTREEGEYWISRCPLKIMMRRLDAMGVPSAEREAQENRIAREIDAAALSALASATPAKDDLDSGETR